MSEEKRLLEDERLAARVGLWDSDIDRIEVSQLLASRIAELRQQLADLKSKMTPDTWFEHENNWDSPEAYAEEIGASIGDEFEITAAVYWPETYCVTKVPDEASDDYGCERTAGGPTAPTEYQKRCAEVAELEQQLAEALKRERLAKRLIAEVLSEFQSHRYVAEAIPQPLPRDNSKDTRWMKEAAEYLCHRGLANAQ